MSQAGTVVAGGAPGLPVTFQADTGSAQPDAFGILNVVTGATDGINTAGAGNTITISLRDRVAGTLITADNNPHTAVSFSMDPAKAGTYTWDIAIAGYDVTNNVGVGYTLVGATRTDGAGNGALITGQALDEFEDLILIMADATLNVVGNDVHIDVQGANGDTIHWKVIANYTLAQ